MTKLEFQSLKEAKEWLRKQDSLKMVNFRSYTVGNDKEFEQYLEKFNKEIFSTKRMDVYVLINGISTWIGCDFD